MESKKLNGPQQENTTDSQEMQS